jgi:cytochrome c oxidase assembly factor CtaG
VRIFWLAILLLAVAGRAAFAHGATEGAGPQWTFDPWVWVPLGIAALVYTAGFDVLWRRSGCIKRGRLRQAAFYAAGWLTLTAALLSPLHWLGERLFTAHMIEHEIVMTVSAPLLVLARPSGVFLWGLPRGIRGFFILGARASILRAWWRAITRPMIATILHGVAIWLWHVPILFDMAVVNVTIHRLQHLSFFATAVLFWWSLLWRANPIVATSELFITMIHTGILGALMTLAPRVLYLEQTSRAQNWGFTPLEDQQLAGLVMWIPVGTVYAGAAITFIAFWIRNSGRMGRSGDAPLR